MTDVSGSSWYSTKSYVFQYYQLLNSSIFVSYRALSALASSVREFRINDIHSSDHTHSLASIRAKYKQV